MADSISGLTGAGGGNMMRITGMATGLDIDGMVKKMMLAEQAKVDKVAQERQAIVWKQQIYQDIIKDVKDLQDTYFDVSNGANYIKSANYFSALDVVVNSTDTTSISATAAAGAKAGTYSISFGGDGQLATVAKIGGSVIKSLASGSVTISNWCKGTEADAKAKTISFSVNGKSNETTTITLGDSYSDEDSIVNAINAEINKDGSLLKGKVSCEVISEKDKDGKEVGKRIKFNALASDEVKITDSTVVGDLDNLKGKAITPSSSVTMIDLGMVQDTSLKFSYNKKPVDIQILKTDKISDVINKISQATSGQVKGSFSELTGEFTLETASTGGAQSIQITAPGIKELGLTDTAEKTGKDSIVYITPPGGTAVRVTKPTNNFTIDGIGYSLLDNKDSSFTVTQNTQKLYDKIDGFLKKYNDVVDKIQTRLTEKKDLNYKPLTDAQKKDMKDDEIKAWEEKAKQGILKNDNNLQNLLSDLRGSFMTAVDGVSLKIGQYGTDAIGIDTGSYKDGGKINIADPEKLKNAIAQHGDELMNLFNKAFVADDTYNNIIGTSEEDKKTKQQEYKFQHQGIFQRLDDILVKNVGYAKTTFNNAILTKYANKQEDFSMSGTGGTNNIPDQIYRKDNKIKELNLKMKDKENALYQQFSRLETIMNNYNSQSSWLAQQFGG